MIEERSEPKNVCVKLQHEDMEAIRLITEYVSRQIWTPHMSSTSVAIRYALRRTVATLAAEVQGQAKRRRTLRRRKSQQVRKGK